MRLPLLLLAGGLGLVGCAQATSSGGNGNGVDASNNNPQDGNNNPMPDAFVRPPDGSVITLDSSVPLDSALPTTKTLSETTSPTDDGDGIGCAALNSGGTAVVYTAAQSFYRVFQLSSFGITGTFHVTNVDYVVEEAKNSPSMKISVGTYSGTVGGNTLTTSDISLTASTTATLPSITAATSEDAVVSAEITGNLIVEIDQVTAGSTSNKVVYFPGANAGGETEPGYVMSASCSAFTVPTSMDSLASSANLTDSDLLITVTGTY